MSGGRGLGWGGGSGGSVTKGRAVLGFAASFKSEDTEEQEVKLQHLMNIQRSIVRHSPHLLLLPCLAVWPPPLPSCTASDAALAAFTFRPLVSEVGKQFPATLASLKWGNT